MDYIKKAMKPDERVPDDLEVDYPETYSKEGDNMYLLYKNLSMRTSKAFKKDAIESLWNLILMLKTHDYAGMVIKCPLYGRWTLMSNKRYASGFTNYDEEIDDTFEKAMGHW